MTEKDATYAFAEQRRRVRPYLLATLLVTLAGFGGMFAVLGMGGDEDDMTLVLGLMLVGLVPLTIIVLRSHRCPSCRKFMGRDLGRLCPMCGVRILPDVS